MLSKQEISRYSRHILLSQIGIEGQEKLKKARVLVIGAGGLGCPSLLYLTAMGVGKIGIIDFDVVDESNLQRQVLFDHTDIGKPKAAVAKAKLQQQNPFVEIEVFMTKLSTENALDIFANFDIVLDGTDNFATRYLVNDACFILKKILVSGSIFKFEGQLTVFDFSNEHTPTYRCLFPKPPMAGLAPSCSEIGVIGVLPGIIGTLMANETIKLVVGIGEVLSGKLLIMNVLNMNFETLEFERNDGAVKSIPKTEIEFKTMDYAYFCANKPPQDSIREMTVDEFFDLMSSNENIQLVDVRQKYEQPEMATWNVLNIPLAEIEEHINVISKNKQVVVVCQSGIRSAQAIEILQNKYGYSNLYNLKGGLIEWIKFTHKNIIV